MELPKYHETFIPILEILNSVESLKSRELASKVSDVYYSELSHELLNQKTSSGANVLLDRILWEKLYCTYRIKDKKRFEKCSKRNRRMGQIGRWELLCIEKLQMGYI